MTAWLISNIGTVIVAVILAAVITAVAVKIYRDRKSGKSDCGCNCSDCPMNGKCG